MFPFLCYLSQAPGVTGTGRFLTVIYSSRLHLVVRRPLRKDLYQGSAANLPWALGKLLPVLLAPFYKQWQALSAHSQRHRSTVQTNMFTIIATHGLETKTSLKFSLRHRVLKASWGMPVTVMFSAREQRRHLENSCLGMGVGVVGPSEPVGRVQGPHPSLLITLLPSPALNLGTSSENLMGTKWKIFIWSKVPTLQKGKLRPQEVKGYAYQHPSG